MADLFEFPRKRGNIGIECLESFWGCSLKVGGVRKKIGFRLRRGFVGQESGQVEQQSIRSIL
jgi:hypothetical protein